MYVYLRLFYWIRMDTQIVNDSMVPKQYHIVSS